MNSNGQIFLLAAIAFAGFTLSIAYFTGQNFIQQPRANFIISEAKNELSDAYYYGNANDDLNMAMWNAGKTMKNTSIASGYTTNLAFIAYDQNSSFVAGNFTSADCQIESSGLPGISVNKAKTLIIPEESLLNKRSVNFCGKAFDLNQYLQYFIEASKGKEVGKWDNLGKQT